MSLRNIATLLAANLLFAGGLAVQAAPQEDSPGVTVNQTGLLHRAPVKYPPEALSKGVEGDVVIEAVTNQKGAVSDARVISGPEELRSAALASVLQWHFANGSTRVPVTISFKAPKVDLKPTPGWTPPKYDAASDKDMGVLKKVVLDDVPQALREALIRSLPAHEGDLVTSDLVRRTVKAALETDEHLQVKFQRDAAEGGAVLRFSLPDAVPAATRGDVRIKVGGNVQQSKLREMRRPKYPPEAKQAGTEGKVRLNAVIAKDGKVKELTVNEGDPLLAAAAMEAVKDWVYEPTVLNGEPVEVITQIDVDFTLSKK